MNLMKSLKTAALAGLICAASITAFAQNQGEALLKQMEEQFKNLKSVSGTFTQSRVDPTFKTRQNVPATFHLLKPSYFRAEFHDAQGQAPSVQLISDKMFYHYVPQLKQVNTYRFQGQNNVRDLNWLLLGFGAKADEIKKVYNIAPLQRGTGVTLTPRSSQDNYFKYITMEVDPQTFYPTRFTMRQTDNTDLLVTINTSTLQLNPSLSPRNFQPDFPKDAQRISMD